MAMAHLKKREKVLLTIAGLLVGMLIVDRLFWQPADSAGGPSLHADATRALLDDASRAPSATEVSGEGVEALADFSAWGGDPFAAAARVSRGPVGRPRTTLRLEAILWSAAGGRALINGKTVEPGDVIGGFRITRIQPDRVVCRRGERVFTLFLDRHGKP